ncbi:MAG: hypothetical protein IKL65_01235 [Bacilli bacterium]|nr:hypothetical protein [Bacilli bacterium]
MINKNLYMFIGKLALEFRLSLDNICKMLGKENTDDNKMEIYNILKELSDNDDILIRKYNYLFFYETLRESENISKISYEKATNYVKRFNKARKDDNKELAKQLLKELDRTELDLISIRKKFGKENLTEEDINIICRYRIKNVLSRLKFCEHFGINRSTLENREKGLTDTVLIQKLNSIAEYYLDLENSKLRRRKR